jgi:hypothetical protein
MVLQLQKPWFIFFLSRLSKCARASQPENKVKLKTNKLQPTPQSTTTHAGRGWYKLPPSSQAEALVILLPSSREIFYYQQEWNDELNRVLFWGPSRSISKCWAGAGAVPAAGAVEPGRPRAEERRVRTPNARARTHRTVTLEDEPLTAAYVRLRSRATAAQEWTVKEVKKLVQAIKERGTVDRIDPQKVLAPRAHTPPWDDADALSLSVVCVCVVVVRVCGR